MASKELSEIGGDGGMKIQMADANKRIEMTFMMTGDGVVSN